MANKILTSNEAYNIADQFALASSALLTFRVNNSARLSMEQQLALEKCENDLDKLVTEFRVRGISLQGTEVEKARTEVLDGVKAAQKYLDTLKKLEKGLAVAVAVVNVARAVIAHDAKGVLTAVKALRDTAKGKKKAKDKT